MRRGEWRAEAPFDGIAGFHLAQGDTLYSLAQKHNTSVDAIQRANKLGKGTTLKLGQKLLLP